MSLKKKTAITIGLIFLALFLIQYISAEAILLKSFSDLEEREVRQHTERALKAVDNASRNIGIMTVDWATWDDTYGYIMGVNDQFAAINVVDSTFINLRLNLMVFLDNTGRMILGKGYDLHDQKEAPLPDGLAGYLSGNSPLLCHCGTERKVDSILLLPDGPMFISARPILTSNGEGPPQGTLIFGRWLNSNEINRIAGITQIPITIVACDDPAAPPDFLELEELLLQEAGLVVRPFAERSIAGYSRLTDIYGKPILILRADLSREIYRHGKAAIFYLIISLLTVTVVFAAAIMVFLHNQVLSRLTLLGMSVNLVAETSDLSTRASIAGKDELSRLGSQINRMLEELELTEEKRKKLEATLQQAQKLRAIGTLAGGIAHDFNNLLMGIQGHATLMLLDANPGHPNYEHLKTIEEIVERAALLTRQLLGFARGGKYEVKSTGLNALLGKSAQMFGRTRKEITIHENLEPDLWPVEIDRGQIEQVLLNLFINASEAMPRGGSLFLSTENRTLDENYIKPFYVKVGNYVKMSITDTGVGLDAETRQRVFEPFFSTKEGGSGVGLGLASAYGIVKNHGGIINVYSEKEKGSTFTVYLPASDQPVISEKKTEKTVVKGIETILLVDDEDMIIEVGEGLLMALGYTVIVARSGSEAIERYRQNRDRIAMVIFDMIMPDMDGEQTYEMLKTINPAVKTILSSGYSMNGQANRIIKQGCEGFLQKPFDLRQLSLKIREVLDSA
ncbi:MAG: response regulator [Deltaproteobacteria bacterium]|nr:response regulator [Deltaproteobacteria bacterium]